MDARVHKAQSGLTIMIFVVLMQHGVSSDPSYIEASALMIRKRLLNPDLLSPVERKRIAPRLKHFPIETEVLFQPAYETNYTTMEVIAQDRPGLLHQVANALLACKVRLLNARISTFGERAEDIFLIHDRDGSQLASQNQKDCLSRTIREGLP